MQCIQSTRTCTVTGVCHLAYVVVVVTIAVTFAVYFPRVMYARHRRVLPLATLVCFASETGEQARRVESRPVRLFLLLRVDPPSRPPSSSPCILNPFGLGGGSRRRCGEKSPYACDDVGRHRKEIARVARRSWATWR